MNRSVIGAIVAFLGVSALFILIRLYAEPNLLSVDPAFARYISAYTSGMVSRKATIKIELSQDYHNTRSLDSGSAALPDSALLQHLISFSPAVEGHAVFTSRRTIEFIPSKPLDEQTTYTCTFRLHKLIKVDPHFKIFRFQFSTYAQNLFVQLHAPVIMDRFHIEWEKLTGTVKLSDVEDSTRLRKTIKAFQDGHELKVRWQASDDHNYTISIDSIVRSEKPGAVEVRWNGEYIHAKETGNSVLDIPALGDFNVVRAEVRKTEQPFIAITFSDPIRGDQDLKGLIRLEGQDNLSYSVEDNVVNVYLPHRIEGTYRLDVINGIRNFKGYGMLKAFQTSLAFEAPYPRVRLQGKGNILPNSQGLFLPFESIGLKAVDVRVMKIYASNIRQFLQVNDLDGNSELKRVGKILLEQKLSLPDVNTGNLNEWTQHVIDLKKFILPDPGSIYRISIKFRKAYTTFQCPDGENDNAGNDESDQSDTEDEDGADNWHGYAYDSGYESWSNYDDDYSPCESAYYNGKAVSRNLFASDLGVIYKLDENKKAHVYVSNMLNAEPLSSAQVEVVDYTRQTLATSSTNGQGTCDIQLKSSPFLIVVKKGNQCGYLKVSDGLSNSLSKFDIEGEHPHAGVKGFLYAERGVWRPGDSMYVTFVLEDKLHTIPAQHPVQFQLRDPNGAVVFEKTSTQGMNHSYDFRCATAPNARTGSYEAVVTLGNNTFSKRFNVETVKPNRLKIQLAFPDSILGLQNQSQPIQLVSRWLHGGKASGLKAHVDMVSGKAQSTFKAWPDYVFESPLRSKSTDQVTVFDGHLDEEGHASFASRFPLSKQAAGLVRLNFTTRVFEPGGDFSIDQDQVLCSPFPRLLGLKLPEQKNADQPLPTNRVQDFHVVMVNERGQLLKSTAKLQLRIYKLKWQWWYDHDDNDYSDFITRYATDIIRDTLIACNDGRATFSMQVFNQNWGRYLVTLTDAEGGHQTGAMVYFDQPGHNQNHNLDKENATMLNFSTDKTSYRKGEKVKLRIPATAKGKALISIENGNRVLQATWINTQVGETSYEFTATQDMTPNVYIHVTYIQPHIHTINDLPIRMYGVIPIEVVDPDTYLQPLVEGAETVRPEETLTLNVREKTGRKMTYTLALVDDGLLDLTHFKTPDPWTTFYAKQALGVKTWDMYDQVIGAYAGKLDAMLTIGGDGDYTDEYANKANRFVPMVKFLGPFTLERGKKAQHKIKIPNYVGSVRAMVVAQQDGAYGHGEKNITVKKPLMILASLPRLLTPGEELEMPVNVFAMEKQIQDVQVSVESNELLSFAATKQQVHFKQTGDDLCGFRFKVAAKSGIAKIRIKAVCGKESSTQEIEVGVRLPNPPASVVKEFTLEAGATTQQDINYTGIEGSNSVSVELSTLPSMGLDKRLEYLVSYPHGCIEQTTSGAFPQLYITALLDVSDSAQKVMQAHVSRAIRRIQLFQTLEGGFSYWPGEEEVNEFGTNYAGHFLLEAERNGYTIPTALKDNWLRYQKSKARTWNNTVPVRYTYHDDESNQFLQAYRLYTLALNHTPELGAMNRLREEKNLLPSARWRLASAYQLAGQPEVARQLVRDASPLINAYRELSFAYGSELRDEAMILETLTQLNDPRAVAQAERITAFVNHTDWLSTQEASFCLLSLCHYYGATPGSGVKLSYAWNKSALKTISSTHKICKIAMKEGAMHQTFSLKNNQSARLYVKMIIRGCPLQNQSVSDQKGLVMQIQYRNMKNEPIAVNRIVQGMDFKAVVTVTNPGNKMALKEMVIAQLFPDGWELHNDRMAGQATGGLAKYVDYRDDRVNTYFDLAPLATKSFTYTFTATYPGHYYLPDLLAEAMYDHATHATIPGGWTDVVRDEQQVAKH